ncbi:uncharacterized protein AMSG_12312, partial [Thecamonas trahens ATCC 50062]
QASLYSPAARLVQKFVRAWLSRRRFIRVIQLALAVNYQQKLLADYQHKLLEYESACIIQRFFRRSKARALWKKVIADAGAAAAAERAAESRRRKVTFHSGSALTDDELKAIEAEAAAERSHPNLGLSKAFDGLADVHLDSPRLALADSIRNADNSLDLDVYFAQLTSQLERGMYLFQEEHIPGVNVAVDDAAEPGFFSMGTIYGGLTVEKLVDAITDGLLSCSTLTDAALLTYRCYVSPPRFANLVIARFWEASAVPDAVVPQAEGADAPTALAELRAAADALSSVAAPLEGDAVRFAVEAVLDAHSLERTKLEDSMLERAARYTERELEAELMEVLVGVWGDEPAAFHAAHTQLGVFLLLRRWMYAHPYDFEDRGVRRAVCAFLHALGAVDDDDDDDGNDGEPNTRSDSDNDESVQNKWHWHLALAQWLLDTMELLLFERNASQFEFARAAIAAPPTMMPDVLQVTAVTQVEPKELARQLTLMEHSLLRAIQAKEFMKQAWAKKGKERNAPHLLALIEFFNHVSGMIATQVLASPSVERRAFLIKYYVAVARHLLALDNFNGIMEVLSALHSAAISRLKLTWAAVEPKVVEEFESISAIMSTSSNFGAYRSKLKAATPPSVPYIGLFLTDLTFADDGNTDHVGEDMINMEKARMVTRIVSELQGYYAGYYALAPLLSVQRFIFNAPVQDEKSLYTTSLRVEPRSIGGAAGASKKRKSSIFRRSRAGP